MTTDPADGFLELQFCPKPKYLRWQYRLGGTPAAHASLREVQPGRHLCGKRGSSRCCCGMYLATESVFKLGNMSTNGKTTNEQGAVAATDPLNSGANKTFEMFKAGLPGFGKNPARMVYRHVVRFSSLPRASQSRSSWSCTTVEPFILADSKAETRNQKLVVSWP